MLRVALLEDTALALVRWLLTASLLLLVLIYLTGAGENFFTGSCFFVSWLGEGVVSWRGGASVS